MPQPKAAAATGLESTRIVSGPDPARFYCPHPGCNRSFAELWRLKVHYRAPPDVRGSGKERGHGTELKWCPKCGKDLKPGKHHVGCSAGKSAPRQAAKRQRQQQMSTTTESEWVSSDLSDSLEAAVKRQATRRQVQQQSEASQGTVQQAARQHAAAAAAAAAAANAHAAQQPAAAAAAAQLQRGDSCRLERIRQGLDTGELLFTTVAGTTDFGLLMPQIKREAGAADVTLAATGMAGGPAAPGDNGAAAAAHGSGSSAATVHHVPAAAMPVDMFDLDLDWLHAPSPSPFGAAGMPVFEADDGDALLRVPSPPPLPPDWEPHNRQGMLFDFDQFDPVKRAAVHAARSAPPPQPTVSAPLVTVTSAMSPHEMANPSDDYIWQILFEGENDPVPKRVTAHLHHHEPLLFDEDPLFDSLMATDLPAPQQQQAQQQPAAATAQQQAASKHAPAAALGKQAAAQHAAAPELDGGIDAMLASLHPTPLSDMMAAAAAGGPAAGSAQDVHSGGTSGGSGLSCGGSLTPPGEPAGGHLSGDAVQQVPQVQPTNGYTNGATHHAAQLMAQPVGAGKMKPDITQLAPAAQQFQPQQVEVAGGPGPDFFGGFL